MRRSSVGTSYAAARIAANSLGTAQLKDDAVTGPKVKDRSLKAVDLRKGRREAARHRRRHVHGYGGPEGPVRIRGIGEESFFNIVLSGGSSMAASLALARTESPASAYLDLYGIRRSGTCRLSGQVVD